MAPPILRKPLRSARLEAQLKEVEKHYDDLKALVDKNYDHVVAASKALDPKNEGLTEKQLTAFTGAYINTATLWKHTEEFR